MPPSLIQARPDPSPTQLHVAAAALFAIVLAMQLQLFQFRPSNGSDDFTAYVSNGLSLATGKPYGMPGYVLNPHYDRADSGQGAYPPGYPIVLAPAVALAQDPVRAAALLNCLLYAGFAGLLVLFAVEGAGLLGAMGLALVAGVSPVFLNEGTLRAPTEPLFLLVLIATCLADRLFWPLRRPGAGGIMAVGAAIAMASLIRVTGVLLGPAFILADVIRRRRLTWPAVLAGGVAGVLFLAVILGVSLDYVVQNFGVLNQGAPPTSGTGGGLLARQGRVLLGNLATMPGNLTTFWTYPGPDAPPDAGTWALLRKLATLPMLGLAAFGFVMQMRRRVTVAETFVVLQTLLLLNLTEILSSPRYWLPVSVLVLFYAVAGGRALGLVLLRGRGAGGVVGALVAVILAVGLAIASDAAIAGRPDAYPLNEARAIDAFTRIAQTPADSLIVARRPRTVVFYGHRASADYHLAPAEPGFWDWAAEARATHLMLFIDQPDVVATARKRGLSRDDAGLLMALDAYEREFFGAERGRFEPVFDNGRYRLFRMVARQP